jgi:hypothetical protein
VAEDRVDLAIESFKVESVEKSPQLRFRASGDVEEECKTPPRRPAPEPTPSDRETLRDMLVASESSMQPWHAHACLDADPSLARPHDLALVREIRSRATMLALHGMAMVRRCSHAVEASELFYAHVAALRPSKVGGFQNADADALVPPICRAFTRSPRPVRVGLNLLGLFGNAFVLLVLFDRFEHDSVQEWLACCAAPLTLPAVVCMAASLNAKTVRGLLKEFETLYVLACGLCSFGVACLLLRKYPAKIFCLILGIPNVILSGFGDAVHESDRVSTSRVWFSLCVVNVFILLALVGFELGDYEDHTFRLLSFEFVATSIAGSLGLTLVTFAAKNVGLSVLRPGSLVMLVSDVCCVLLDAETLALLKAVYLLLGQAYGNDKVNSTVAGSLRYHRNSILGSELIMPVHMPAPATVTDAVAPAPEEA